MEDKFSLKTKIYANKQSIQLLKEVHGTRAFIVSDSIMEKLGYLKIAVDCLSEAGISSVTFTDVRPDPDVKVIANGMKVYMQSGADVLVALGGGSTIDTAKGILYSMWQFGNAEGQQTTKPLFIAIPSTSGTGSEVTNFSVITSDGKKVCIVDDFIAPDMAILDSTCIQHVPPRVVVDTGIDVLVHAIEAYVSIKATDFTDALAEKAVKLIFEYLPIVAKDPSDPNARDRVQNASCMAGIAFTNSNLGINHSLAHAMGGKFHIAHGRSNALMLTGVMDYNANLAGGANSRAAERYAKLAAVLQLPARTIREGAVSFMQAVKKLEVSLGIEENIRSLNIAQADFDNAVEQMAETALLDRCTPTNPRKPSKQDLICIYQKSF
jgi:alcohol dehydrogenase class IV